MLRPRTRCRGGPAHGVALAGFPFAADTESLACATSRRDSVAESTENADPQGLATLSLPPALSSPQATLRLYLASLDDLVTTDKLLELAGLEPVFAVELLRAGNAASHGRAGGVNSLREAIAVIGLRGLQRLALAHAARTATAQLNLPRPLLDTFWWQSVVRAATCATLARGLDLDPENAFAVGLLQDLGLFALLHSKPDRMGGWPWLFQVDDAGRVRLEREFFGVDHAACFAVLGRAWGLPPLIVDAIAAHHDAKAIAALPRSVAAYARLASAADVVARHTSVAVHPVGAPALGDVVRAQFPGIGPRDVEGLVAELPRCADETALALGITRPAGTSDELARSALRELVERGEREAERLRVLQRQFEERASAANDLRRAQAELEKKAYCDPLTGIGNRRTFDEAIERFTAESSRSGSPLSLVVVDVDHFKAVNDRFGHAFGDSVLRAVAEVLVRCTRATDVRARIGGEEFAVILPGATQGVGERVAEKIRSAIASLRIEHSGHSVYVTVSAGGRTTGGGVEGAPLNAKELFQDADAALYLSKRRGRDRVTWSAESVGGGGPQRGTRPMVQAN
jgi:diguanylate cyclase (GGDEF)-like protein